MAKPWPNAAQRERALRIWQELGGPEPFAMQHVIARALAAETAPLTEALQFCIATLIMARSASHNMTPAYNQALEEAERRAYAALARAKGLP